MKRVGRRRLIRLSALVALGLGAFFLYGALAHGAKAKALATLNCSVGPGFTISSDAGDGLPAGTYTWSIHDMSSAHNCNLVGTGCSSTVPFVGDTSCEVTLAAGTTYTFRCDAHPTQMTGSFTTAGGAPPPPPPPPPPPSPGDQQAPRVTAHAARVKHGTSGKLRFDMSDDSGKATVTSGVYRGTTRVTDLGSAVLKNGAYYDTWKAPKKRQLLSYCVMAEDASGKARPLHGRRKRPDY